MGQPAAKQGDQIIGNDIHIVLVPSSPPVSQPFPFRGIMNGGLSSDVRIMGLPAATVGSSADNTPPHILLAPGTAFQKPPRNGATIRIGSPTVKINGKPAARHGDTADTCNDPVDLPNGTVMAAGTVRIG